MGKIKYLLNKTVETIKEEGIKVFFLRVHNWIRYRRIKKNKKEYKDILFICGCYLPHPKRYRVEHQIEQLMAFDMSADYVNYENVEISDLKYYRGFVFFRCPITDTIKNFIQLAKENNKKVFFDVDDLVIDTKYTDQVKYVSNLPVNEKKVYDDGVNRMNETLKLCDYAITSTERLAEELSHYVKDVYINHNCASEEMVKISEKAIMNTNKDKDKIIIGYLSGSITHNDDFKMILPALIRILDKYDNVYLKVVGTLDLPVELVNYKERILTSPFMDWRKLPYELAGIDINLAPIEDTLFNEAKSENKWIEASLCKTVTVASNVGEFKNCIDNMVTGILCDNTENDWYIKLCQVIDSVELREKIAQSAYEYVIENNITILNGQGLADFLEDKLAKNIAFVLPTTNISGGVNVVLKHCSILRKHGFDVFIINLDDNNNDIHNQDGITFVLTKERIDIIARINTMVATLWFTVEYMIEYPRVKHMRYLVQGFETDFMKYSDYGRIRANRTYNTYKPIEYLTISKWCQNWLKNRYNKTSIYGPNGLNLELFSFKERKFNSKVKVLIEGNCLDYKKNVDEAFKISNLLDKDKFEIQFLSYQGEPKKWYYVDKFMHKIPYEEVGKVYQDADILLKTSLSEGFSYPPLEMMATGGVVVAIANGGNVEFMKDRYNCLFFEHNDINGALKCINELVDNKQLREQLIQNGLETARSRAWENIENDIVNLYIGGVN